MKKTSWTKATTDINKAIISLIACLDSNINAWIEIQNNGEQDHPIEMKNPELDNPFNWRFSYGVPRSEKDLRNRKFFNDTEKDLTYNWVSCFGTQEAIDLYQKDNKITKGLLDGGINHPVKKDDAEKYRETITGDNHKYGFWVAFWQPKDNIPFWVVDKNINKVFVICHDDKPCNKEGSIKKAGEFLLHYSNILSNPDSTKEFHHTY